MRRASSGIFFDLVNSAGFDNAFGYSFQEYVGEVLDLVCKPPQFTIAPEESYYIGSNKFHGADWVVSDATGHLFIEAKTKRLTLGAKFRSDDPLLQKDLGVIATAIVQHYGNIQRALNGKSKWRNDGLPIYPLVLTLEDWFIFSPRISEMLVKEVRRLLAKHGISEQVLSDMPFSIAAVREFEAGIQVIAQVGIGAVMDKKTRGDKRSWSLLPFIGDSFPNEMKNVNWRLFVEDWDKLLP